MLLLDDHEGSSVENLSNKFKDKKNKDVVQLLSEIPEEDDLS